jgi:hypothetical protein
MHNKFSCGHTVLENNFNGKFFFIVFIYKTNETGF